MTELLKVTDVTSAAEPTTQRRYPLRPNAAVSTLALDYPRLPNSTPPLSGLPPHVSVRELADGMSL